MDVIDADAGAATAAANAPDGCQQLQELLVVEILVEWLQR